MRRSLVPLFLAIAVVALAAPARRAEASGTVSISFFFDELSPHGDWVTTGSYGHCWRPRGIAHDWQPYQNGEWLYTEDGWTWVSYDPWGGDPYHYGTWSQTDSYGWVWIPGIIWAPAWVTWSFGDGYVGWAPVPPSFNVGMSGYLGPAVTVSRNAYVFVPTNQFVGTNIGTVRVPVTQNGTFLARTRPATRFAASRGVLTSGGPTVMQVENETKHKISRVSAGDAHTQAVPLEAGLRGHTGTVIAPATERAKYIKSPSAQKVARAPAKAPQYSASMKHEKTQPVNRSAPQYQNAPQQHQITAQHQNAPHEKTVRHETASAPAQKKNVSHQQAVPASSHQGQAPKAEPAAKSAAPSHEKHQPPAQSGKGHAPKTEHGHPKAE